VLYSHRRPRQMCMIDWLVQEWLRYLRSLHLGGALHAPDFILDKDRLLDFLEKYNLQVHGADIFKGSFFERRKNSSGIIFKFDDKVREGKFQRASPLWWKDGLPKQGQFFRGLCIARNNIDAVDAPRCLDKDGQKNQLTLWSDTMYRDVCYCQLCTRITCRNCMFRFVSSVRKYLTSRFPDLDGDDFQNVRINICPDCYYTSPHVQWIHNDRASHERHFQLELVRHDLAD